jgi:hypothetical protein
MTTEAQCLPARPYSLHEIVELFLGDLTMVPDVELAAQIDNPLLGKLFELVLERRRVARLQRDEGIAPDNKTARH